MSLGPIRNREGVRGFDVHWPSAGGGELERGITAVLRVKNEARNLPWVLPGLLAAVDRVVLVDNQSTDDTAGVARAVAEHHGATGRLEVASYPFAVSRCGPENLATPGDSVHSLTHFNNWAFAHARTQHTMKWDGDLVLTREGASALDDLAWQLRGEESVVVFQHHPLYVESPEVGYFDAKPRNVEPWICPQGPDYSFIKGFDWEIRTYPDGVDRWSLPRGLCFELKWLDLDEFAHWTTPYAFDPLRSPRKVREYDVFTALQEHRFDDLDSVHRIEAPPGVHVVDHVAQTWLPRAPRELLS